MALAKHVVVCIVGDTRWKAAKQIKHDSIPKVLKTMVSKGWNQQNRLRTWSLAGMSERTMPEGEYLFFGWYPCTLIRRNSRTALMQGVISTAYVRHLFFRASNICSIHRSSSPARIVQYSSWTDHYKSQVKITSSACRHSDPRHTTSYSGSTPLFSSWIFYYQGEGLNLFDILSASLAVSSIDN